MEPEKFDELVEDLNVLTLIMNRNLDRIFSHISRDFRYRSLDRNAFRQRSEDVLRNRNVEEVVVWDFERGDADRKERRGTVRFMVKPRGNWQGNEAGYLCEARFVLDPDGQWRMSGFQIFNPFRESNQELIVPGF